MKAVQMSAVRAPGLRRLGALALGVALALPLFCGAGSSSALADYPDKPIRLIIPYRAGGGSDSLARTLQKAIEVHKLLPVPLVIVNVDGAGGAVGARRVKDAQPDGYTFLQMHNGLLALMATGRLDYGPQEYVPVAQTTQSCLYLAVPGSSPYRTFEDLVKAAKTNPNAIKLADAVGDVTHFTIAQMMKATGMQVGIVQAGGTAKRFAMLKGGHTQAALMSPGWIKRGGTELRGLIWLGPARHKVAPDMPTAKEKGIDVVSCLNRRFWAPKGTPADRVAYFADVLKKAMATEELKAYHAKTLSDIHIRTGADVAKDVTDEFKSFQDAAPVVKASMTKK